MSVSLPTRLLSLPRPHPPTPAKRTPLQSNPSATLEEAMQPAEPEEELRPVQIQYEDAYEYQNILGPLVEEEAEHVRRLKEKLGEVPPHLLAIQV